MKAAVTLTTPTMETMANRTSTAKAQALERAEIVDEAAIAAAVDRVAEDVVMVAVADAVAVVDAAAVVAVDADHFELLKGRAAQAAFFFCVKQRIRYIR